MSEFLADDCQTPARLDSHPTLNLEQLIVIIF